MALLDTVTSLQGSDCGVFIALEVHDPLTKAHDILENAVSKWVSYTTHILVFLSYSASRQDHEVWASLFPFLLNIEDSFLPASLAFMDTSNGPLQKSNHLSSLGMSQSSTSMRHAMAKTRAGFLFNIKKQSCDWSLVVPSCQRSLTLILSLMDHQGDRKSMGRCIDKYY